MKEWGYNMAGSDFWEGMLSAGQIDFIIDECKKSLAFGDYFDPYDMEDNLTSETTQYLVHVTTLLERKPPQVIPPKKGGKAKRKQKHKTKDSYNE